MRGTALRFVLAFAVAAGLALAPAVSAAEDTEPPRTKLTYPPIQDFVKSREVVVYVRCNEDATAEAGGQLEIGEGRSTGRLILGLTFAESHVERREKAKLRLRVPRATREAAERALAKGKQVLVKVTVQATDTAGNESGKTIAVIRPKL
ncbi:MAG TPA: hypothetical protein VFJ57_09695 [Solirubrobacterales bacterium]|nr:hypothetical protein [Solirubrobacterales bacterium]